MPDLAAVHRPVSDATLVGAAVVLPAIAATLLVPWRTSLPPSVTVLVVVTAVVVVAGVGHRPAGWLAALVAAAAFDLLLTRPYGSFDIAARDDIETAVLLLVVGVAVTEIAARARRHRRAAERAARWLTLLDQVSAAARRGGTAAGVQAATGALREILRCDDVTWEPGTAGGLPRLDHAGGVGAVGTDTVGGDARWDVAARGLPPMPFEIVVGHDGDLAGRFVVSPTVSVPTTTQAVLLAHAVVAAAVRPDGSRAGGGAAAR